ncbi:putative arrestin-like protein [Septoria linicola]|nr:putative arrestin-like protein [Septoria linicola]
MSKLGKLQAKILVDGLLRPHYGPSDKVTGTITLVYQPYSSVFKKNVETTALFGPLKLDVILTGRIRLRIRRERSHALPTNHDVALFASKFTVYRGSFEPEVGKEYSFPFRASFPRSTETLPPSFSLLFHDVPDIVDVAVQYRLAADVQMPGIAIEMVHAPLEAQAPIRYEIAKSSLASIERSRDVFKLRHKIQNQYLLPEDQQPQGFKGKAKAIFTSNDSFPTFVLDIFCTDQRRIYPGQQLKFEVTLRRDDSETTAPAVPDISLDSFKAELKGITQVDGSQRLIGPPISYDKSGVQIMVCQNSFPVSLSKANDYSTLITTDQLSRHASSFNHPKLARTYILKITMVLTIAKKSTKLVKDCPVVVVSPPKDLQDTPIAGSSRRAVDDYEDEVLPSYEEAPAYETTDPARESTKMTA